MSYYEVSFEDKVSQLLEAAPSDSTAQTKIFKMKDGYAGEIKICSTEGRFSASGERRNLSELSERLINEIWGQIKKWRQSRFLPEEEFNRCSGEKAWFGAA